MEVSPGRRLPVQLWYPAVESARAAALAGRPVLDFEPPGPEREMLSQLQSAAPATYTQRTQHAADAPDVLELASFPLILISHCNECLRFAYFSTAEQLASRGFVVASPDHLDNTLYDLVNGTSVGLELNDFLERRRLDIAAITDILLDPNASVVPAGLRGKLDIDRIGMLGHSFGAITAAYASTRDPRIRAIVILTMIVSQDNTLPYTGDELAQRVQLQPLSKPALFVLATEDMIALFGMNDWIRDNFQHYPAEAWLATMQDAGHYSVTNICGIRDEYTNGCGEGVRVTSLLEPFTYLDIDTATSLTGNLASTFFEKQLLGASPSTLEAITASAPSVLSLEHHQP
jgi:predicted dienelactone hydrolase